MRTARYTWAACQRALAQARKAASVSRQVAARWATCGGEVLGQWNTWRMAVGSKGTQPNEGKYTSGHVCASRSVILYCPAAASHSPRT